MGRRKRYREGERWGRWLYALFAVIGRLPAWWHYLCSTLISYILQYVWRYRKAEIESHLSGSFPEKSAEELRKLTRRVYLNLTDIMVEVIMLAAFSERRLQKHIFLKNGELLGELHKAGYRHLFLALGHYGNWEWLTGLQVFVPESQFRVLYQHQNSSWNYLLSRVRSKFGAQLLDRDQAAHHILHHLDRAENQSYIFVADQAPSAASSELFIPFLNRQTAVFTGLERLARIAKSPVLYIDVTKVGRGKYEAEVKLLTRDASKEKKYAVTVAFMQALEQTIRRAPEYWLWSHRRWKFPAEYIRQAFPNKRLTILSKAEIERGL